MAKQNVTFIERHIEKVVMGVAGVALVFALVFRVVLSPHRVDVNGDLLGPAQFYDHLADQAEAARAKMQRASGADDSNLDSEILAIIQKPEDQPPADLSIAPVGLNPPMPKVTGEVIGPQGKTKLATILPPTQPILTQGRAAARLPVPREIYVGDADARGRESLDVLPPTEDWYWVTACAAMSRLDQREAFMDAGYLTGRLQLIVSEVLVQRQEALPDGRWSQPVLIMPYVTERFVGRKTVDLVPDATGYGVTAEDDTYITTFRSALVTSDAQENILRPKFQALLTGSDAPEDNALYWTVPEQIQAPDGTVIDLTKGNFGILFPRETPGEGRPGRQPGTSEDQTAGPGKKMNPGEMRDMLRDIETALEAGNLSDEECLEKREQLRGLSEDSETPRPQKTDADRLLAKYQRDFELAEFNLEIARRQESQKDSTTLGEDVEPLWANDTTVQPGKTYRYRLCLTAINQYAGLASQLENPTDARKVVVQGEWSPWSKAIYVTPKTRLLVTSARKSTNGDLNARVELMKWTRGEYVSGTGDLGLGDVTACKTRTGDELSYDALIVGMALDIPFPKRTTTRNNELKYGADETSAVFLVKADGEADWRLANEDKDIKRDLAAEIKELERLKKQQQDQSTETRTRTGSGSSREQDTGRTGRTRDHTRRGGGG